MAVAPAPRFTLAQLKWIAMHYGGLGNDGASMAAAIALQQESGGDPAATNYNVSSNTFDRGLWQINTVHGNTGVFANDSVYSIAGNARAMAALSANGTDFTRAWDGDVGAVASSGLYQQALTTPAVQPVTTNLGNISGLSPQPYDPNLVFEPTNSNAAGGALPASWRAELTKLGGIFSGNVLQTNPGASQSSAGGGGASSSGPLPAVTNLGKAFKRDLLLALKFGAGVLAILIGLWKLLGGSAATSRRAGVRISTAGSWPVEVSWVLIWGGALLVWTSLKLQSTTCVLENAISGKTRSCTIASTGSFLEGLFAAIGTWFVAKGILSKIPAVIPSSGGGTPPAETTPPAEVTPPVVEPVVP